MSNIYDNITAAEALGSICSLLSVSELHKNWTADDISNNILPALARKQCKIYYSQAFMPIAFVTWAFFSDEIHNRLLEDGVTPLREFWRSGNNLWFIDVVAPYGHATKIIRDLRTNHFSGISSGYSIKRNKDGSINRIKRWKNANALLMES